jgi:hypothetical protein
MYHFARITSDRLVHSAERVIAQDVVRHILRRDETPPDGKPDQPDFI